MRALARLLRVGVLLAMLAGMAFSAVLTAKQEGRLHPLFRSLLRNVLDANGLLQATHPEAWTERGAIIYTSDPASLRAAGIRLQSVFDGFATARVRPADLLQLSRMDAVTFVDPGAENYPEMDVSRSETGASLLQAGFLNQTPYKGEGAIVLIYDTGIDWKHLDFRDPNDTTKTRILAIWDQTLTPQAGESSPAGFTYGVEYTKAQIENEIDGSPAGFVREADVNGHGTHVAGTAAGNGGGATGKYVGMAPLADIIVVRGGDASFAEDKMIDGLTYAGQKAGAFGKPIVVNWSIGGHIGPHDGTRPYERAADSFVGTPGQVVCISAGNDGNVPIHINHDMSTGETDTLRVVVPSYTPTAGTENDKVFLDVWFNGGPDMMATVVSPTGIIYTRDTDETGTAPNQTDGTIELYNYRSPWNLHRNVQLLVHDQTASTPAIGTWLLVLANTSGQPVSYNAWLANRTVGNKVASLPDGNTQMTVAMPGTSRNAITVGSYITRFSWPAIDAGQYIFSGGTDRVGDYSLFTGIGPTADIRQKPDIAAPGEAIVSSLSSSVNMSANQWAVAPDGRHQTLRGTSMAAPHVTGAVALLLGANPALTASDIMSLFMQTAEIDEYTNAVPSVTWGYGKLDILEAVAKARNTEASVTRTVFSYDQTGDSYYWLLTGTSKFAVRFSPPGGGVLGEVQVKLDVQANRSVGGNGSLICEAYSDNGGVPGARIGTAVQAPLAMLSAGTNNPVMLVSANAQLVAGMQYYIVLSLSQPTDTLAVLSDQASNGFRSMRYNGTKWSALSQNFRVRPVVVSTSNVNGIAEGLSRPQAFRLEQNYPNPFNPKTRIKYTIGGASGQESGAGKTRLTVYDVLGRQVATLVDEVKAPGSYGVEFDGSGLASGVYFYRLTAGDFVQSRKMIMLK